MPKSKREKKAALSVVKKKTRSLKEGLVAHIRESIQQFQHIYIFDVENMKNSVMKEIREEWNDSKFYLGKNKVMSLALGRSSEDEQLPNLSKLSSSLINRRGLLFTNRPAKQVMAFFRDFSSEQYARSGYEHTGGTTYILGPGLLPADLVAHSQEPLLRKLGLPTRLVQGKIDVVAQVEVAKPGDILTPEQCRILEIFNVKLATFRLSLLYHYHKGKIAQLPASTAAETEEEEESTVELRDVCGSMAFAGEFQTDMMDEQDDEQDEDEM